MMSKAINLRKFILFAVAALLMFACSLSTQEPTNTPEPTATTAPTATSTPVSTTGFIAGAILDHNGNPLLNIYDEETMIVAIVCTSEESDIECLDQSFMDMDFDDRIAAICQAEESGSSCQVHVGDGALNVESSGYYTFFFVAPGEYGLVFLFSNGNMTQMHFRVNIGMVNPGEITQYNFETDLSRD